MKGTIYIVLFLSIAGIIYSCNKKSIPVITERESGPMEHPVKSIVITPDLAVGKRIFTNRCGNCHDLPKPETYTGERWVSIMSSMSLRARLSAEQDIHVMAYLKANAAK